MQKRKSGQPHKGWKKSAQGTKELRGPMVKTSDFESENSGSPRPANETAEDAAPSLLSFIWWNDQTGGIGAVLLLGSLVALIAWLCQ